VFVAVLGGHLDGSVLRREVGILGAFTFLWLGLAFVMPIKTGYFALLGLAVELFLALVLQRLPH
jgi:hypothetical protein